MQIASMFASLGFKVDTSGLDKFKQSISQARKEIGYLGANTNKVKRNFDSLKHSLEGVDKALNKVRGAGANNRIITSYRDMSKAVENVDKHLRNIATHQQNTTKAIGKINSSVHSGIKYWNDYANAVNRARDALRQVRRRVSDLQHNRNIDINVRERRTGSGVSGNGSVSNSASGDGSTIIPLLGRGGIRSLLGASMPSMLLGGGLASVGYLGHQVVKQGQEQTRMELALQMSSKDMNEFRDSLKYVKEEALRLGLTSQELGKAFAQVNMAAEGLSQDKKKQIFTGLNEYMATMQLDPEKQKGVYTAFYQMFSKGKISQEEINQLAERGFSQKVFRDAIKQAYGLKSNAEAIKMQEQGKITDVGKVWEIYAKNLQKMARESGAYDAMLKSSAYNMNTFKESLAQLSKELMDSGLDELLGDVFRGLTSITNALIPLAQNLKPVIAGFKDLADTIAPVVDFVKYFISENMILSGVMLLLIGKGGSLAKVIERVIFAFKNGAKFSGVFAYVIRTVMGSAILKMIGKFGVWAIAIWAVSKALAFVHEQVERRKLGQYTFFDWLMGEVKTTGLEFDLLNWKIGLTMANLAAYGRMVSSFGLNKIAEGVRGAVGLNPQQTEQQRQDAIRRNQDRFAPKKDIGSMGGFLGASSSIPIPRNSNQPVQLVARNVNVNVDRNGNGTVDMTGARISMPYMDV